VVARGADAVVPAAPADRRRHADAASALAVAKELT
jgi:hypothetical protein